MEEPVESINIFRRSLQYPLFNDTVVSKNLFFNHDTGFGKPKADCERFKPLTDHDKGLSKPNADVDEISRNLDKATVVY